SLDARIIIMDEPTSSLTLTETQTLLRVIGELKAAGVAIIFITHRLGEIEACADRVVCLRDGRVVGALDRDEIHHDRMVRMMVGRDLRALYIPPAVTAQPDAVEIRGVRTATYPDQEVTLSVGRGEILGLAGLVGSGRTELARAMFGIDRMLAGEVRLDGTKLTIGTPRAAIAQGLFLVPEDRKRSGLVLDMTIAENVTLPGLGRVAKRWLIDGRGEAREAEAQREKLRIRTPSVTTTALKLSGGNQQKIVLAKWLALQPRFLIFDEPTRGIDVGAKSEIYQLMRTLADRGVPILMISSDMEEVIGVSDRIAVMHEGRIAGTLDRDRFSEPNVMQLAVGRPLAA
uniref:sugar ABC transporter ATP-binding protein n=1 Tax=Inquilinus sp. TaxID=1932117 RepID=UPI0037831A5F